MSFLSDFTHQYKLSKTLRFELRPCDPTGNPITGAETVADYKNNFLSEIVQQDQKRAEDYQLVKSVIDDYHRTHIDRSLTPAGTENFLSLKGGKTLSGSDFYAAHTLYRNLKTDSSEQAKEGWNTYLADLRKKVSVALDADKNLFKKDKKELITKSLPEFLKGKEVDARVLEALDDFAKFTTYFTGFHENRKNMYVAEEQATAIPFRTINDNMVKFFQNVEIFTRVKTDFPELYTLLNDAADLEALQALDCAALDDLFAPASFIKLMGQKSLDKFQLIIGGFTTEQGNLIRGLKGVINDFTHSQMHALALAKKEQNQEEIEALNKGIRTLKRCKFIPLFKQILSETESSSFIPEGFHSDAHLCSDLSTYLQSYPKQIERLQDILTSLYPSDPDTLSHIYLKTDRIGELSILLYGSRLRLTELVEQHRLSLAKAAFPLRNGKLTKTAKDKRDAYKLDLISVHTLNGLLIDYYNQLDPSIVVQDKSSLQQRLSLLIENTHTSLKELSGKSLSTMISRLEADLLQKESVKIHSDRRLPSEDQPQGGTGYQQIALIKEPLDAILKQIHAMGHLHLVKSRKPMNVPDADSSFYADFNEQFLSLESETIQLYNKVRNYLSKKPYKLDKIKVNFSNPTFLGGWAVKQEIPNSTIMLRRNGNFYLGVLNATTKKNFKGDVGVGSPSAYQKMYYNQVADPGKDVQNLMVIDGHTVKKNGRKDPDGVNRRLEALKEEHLPQEINDIRVKRSYSVASENFDRKDLSRFIDYYKERTQEYYNQFRFHFKSSDYYSNFAEFTNDVNEQGYGIYFMPLCEKYVETLVKNGDLFLFQIYNKDFSPSSKGKPNLHTLYWRSLFDPVNLENVVTKLDGEAEMFFRQKSLSSREVARHKAGEPIENKNTNNPKKFSTFDYDLVKDRRFTVDKFLLHVPVTLNFKSEAKPKKFNLKVNEKLAKSDEACIIGIDRGERNLLAYTVINQNGEIIEKGDINQIETDQGYKVDYHAKLDAKEKQRDAARKSWGAIENIKELKEGYLSHVVHKVAYLIEKHNAMVCLEDLNFGFKRGRFKVEKQVYQKFEKALIDKLNYLVFKEKRAAQAGHHLNAYQLTAPFESFQKLGKQTGILYYVTAAYTSKICPATGFVNFLDLRYKSLGRAIEFFERIDSFSYNEQAKRYELSFNYNKMESLAPRATEKGRQQWTLGTHGDLRYRNEKRNNHWVPVEVNSTDEIAKILEEEAGIIAMPGENIAPQLITLKDDGFKNSSKLFKRLFKALNTAFSLRQSKTGTDIDFILSPVVLEDGSYFDSQTSKMKLPSNADENGGYHIALKGLWTLEQMQKDERHRSELPTLSNNDWIPFAQRIATAKGAGMANP